MSKVEPTSGGAVPHDPNPTERTPAQLRQDRVFETWSKKGHCPPICQHPATCEHQVEKGLIGSLGHTGPTATVRSDDALLTVYVNVWDEVGFAELLPQVFLNSTSTSTHDANLATMTVDEAVELARLLLNAAEAARAVTR